MTDIERLIAASSLGTPDAVAMRARTSDERAAAIVARAEELAVEEADLPCCWPMDEAHTLPNGHTVFCRDEMNRERA